MSQPWLPGRCEGALLVPQHQHPAQWNGQDFPRGKGAPPGDKAVLEFKRKQLDRQTRKRGCCLAKEEEEEKERRVV